MYILKPEYEGTIMEILTDETRIVFDTTIEPSSRYPYFYEVGFTWCFDKI